MLETENIPFYPKNEQLNTNISNQNINRNLNLKENEKDEKYSNKDEQQEHSSEDENLGYNSKYSLNKKNKYNMDNSNLEDTSLKSKASTVSTGISQNEVYLEQINLLYPGNLKMEKNDRKESFTMYNNINFTRERLNSTPITNYYQGIDYYLREKQPENNNYTKSGNFVEKEKFFRENDFYFKNMKYKSFDLSEQKKFFSNQALKNIEDNNIKSNYNNMMNFPTNKLNQINIENKIQNSTINNINIINNQPMIMQIPPNFENGSGKFDMPIYYVRYCDLDFSKGIPMVPYMSQKNNEIKNNNNGISQGTKQELKEDENNKKIPAILVPAPLFYNPILKNNKNMYGKYQKKKSRPFIERQGDWVCKYCRNLNFSFRNECNRCKLLKKVCLETEKPNEENDMKNKGKIQNKKIYKYKKNNSNQINDKDSSQNQKYNVNEKSIEE